MNRFLQLFLFCLFVQSDYAQVAVSGRVYDVSQKAPLEGVSVMSNSGKGTVSDSSGYYKLVLTEKDSIWFSYLGKSTPKYAVKTLPYPLGFDISLQVKSNILPTVMVWKPGYRQDSLENRQNYAKIFGYSKPGFSTSMAPAGSVATGVGVDLDELIDVFRFRKKKRMLALQDRLIQEEEDKYIDFRFSKSLVKKLTNIPGERMEEFINLYKPDYEFVKSVNEAELGIYIQLCYDEFKAGRKTMKEKIQMRVLRYEF